MKRRLILSLTILICSGTSHFHVNLSVILCSITKSKMLYLRLELNRRVYWSNYKLSKMI
jgi:hypothetical protein